jgi:hypothetical protein
MLICGHLFVEQQKLVIHQKSNSNFIGFKFIPFYRMMG